MDSVRFEVLRDRLVQFMHEDVYPNEQKFQAESHAIGLASNEWTHAPILVTLKKKAKAAGLWNMFLPVDSASVAGYEGGGLTNLQYAFPLLPSSTIFPFPFPPPSIPSSLDTLPLQKKIWLLRQKTQGKNLTLLNCRRYADLCEIMGTSVPTEFAAQCTNCTSPDTGNMEVLARFGTTEQKEKWLKPLLEGNIRSAFAMTEPAVASSDATNISIQIEKDGGDYVINGRKWWITGAGSLHCKIMILMGKTNPEVTITPATCVAHTASHHRRRNQCGTHSIRPPRSTRCRARSSCPWTHRASRSSGSGGCGSGGCGSGCCYGCVVSVVLEVEVVMSSSHALLLQAYDCLRRR
jgi:hypothetical protein